MSNQSETIMKQIEASANGQEPEAKEPQPFPPAFLARVRMQQQAVEAAQAVVNNSLVCFFYGKEVDPATEHIKHDLNAGTWTLLDGPPEEAR